jgi:peptide/nickel transport system substrate-binding protein
MNKHRLILRAKLLLIASTLLLSFMVQPMATAAVSSSIGPLEGPYFKEIRFKIYASSEAEVAGLLSGDVDVMDFFEAEQIPDIQPGLTAGTIETAQSAEQGMWGFSFQCERYPLTLTKFRQAIAHLVDKDKYVREGLQGLGYKIETFIESPGYGPWAATEYVTYDFNPTLAGQILDSIGFVKGPDGKRIDPLTGETMRPLVIIARTEHPHRIFSARELAAQMDVVGIPYDLQEVPRSVASPLVFLEQNYDIYTSGWGGGPDVDWLWDIFDSNSPPEQNYQMFKNATVDAALDKLKYGSTYEECLEGAHEAQYLLSEQVPFIPLYAKAYLSPYNARLENVVDLPWWSGVTNSFTMTFATDKTQKYGSVLNVGWTSDPQQPSPMYEINWWWDAMLNNVIYDALINLDPQTFEELPWLAESWTTEPWTTPEGGSGLKLSFNLRDDVTWHDGKPFTADDVVFTWTYAKEQENPVYISYLKGLQKAETEGTYTAVAYLNTTSFWALHWVGANIPMIPKHIWENIEDSVTYQPIADGNLIGTGPYKFKEYRPGEYVIVEANPKWFLKPADSTLGYTTYTLTQGETKAFTKTEVIGTKPITNGTYTATVLSSAGATVKTFTGTAAADGTYTVTVDSATINPGTYTVTVEFTAPVTNVGIGARDDYILVVQATQPVVEETPPDYTLYYALVGVVVVIAAGYVVMRRRAPGA